MGKTRQVPAPKKLTEVFIFVEVGPCFGMHSLNNCMWLISYIKCRNFISANLEQIHIYTQQAVYHLCFACDIEANLISHQISLLMFLLFFLVSRLAFGSWFTVWGQLAKEPNVTRAQLTITLPLPWFVLHKNSANFWGYTLKIVFKFCWEWNVPCVSHLQLQ